MSAEDGGGREFLVIPDHTLLIVEERLKEHQEDGVLALSVDVTELALLIR